MHFILSVTVFNTRVIIFIGDTIFTSPTGRWDCHVMWSFEPGEGPAICRAKAVPSFLSHFKTLGIKPLTSHSSVKH